MTREQVRIRAELKRIAKVFRQQERASARAARLEERHDCPVAAANLDGNASAMKYCAEHVEAVVARMVNSRPQERKDTV